MSSVYRSKKKRRHLYLVVQQVLAIASLLFLLGWLAYVVWREPMEKDTLHGPEDLTALDRKDELIRDQSAEENGALQQGSRSFQEIMNESENSSLPGSVASESSTNQFEHAFFAEVRQLIAASDEQPTGGAAKVADLARLVFADKESEALFEFTVKGQKADVLNIQWEELAKSPYTGGGWVRGCWYLNFSYDRRMVLNWVNARVQEFGGLARAKADLRNALWLVFDHDPVLAVHLSLWEVALSLPRELPDALARFAVCLARVEGEGAFQNFWNEPLEWVPPLEWCQAIGGLPAVDDQQLAGSAWISPLIDRVDDKLAETIVLSLQKISHLFVTGEECVRDVFSSESMADQEAELHMRFELFGRYSHLTHNAWWRFLWNHGRYVPLGRTQDQLYLCTEIIRRYNGHPANLRAIPLLLGMQLDGIQSESTGAARYHDRFNAMEAIVYAQYLIGSKPFRGTESQEPVAEYLQEMGRKSLAIAFNEEDHRQFKATYDHRFMVLDAMMRVNMLVGRQADNEEWCQLLLYSDFEIPITYRARSKRRLAGLYRKTGRYDQAMTLYREMVDRTLRVDNVAVALIGIYKVAVAQKDRKIYEEYIRIAQEEQKRFEQLPAEERRGSLGFVPLLETPWPYDE